MNVFLKNKSVQKTITILLIFLVLYLSYKFGSKLFHDFQMKREQAKRKQTIQNYLDGSIKDPHGDVNQVITLPDEKYITMADTMYNSMNGFGTDIQSILNVLAQLKTKADWLKLSRAFGTRKSSWIPWEGDLMKWLHDETDTFFKEKVNQQLRRFDIEI